MSARPEIVYFLGIGGIGMSALARWYHSRGVIVLGYDRYASVLTTVLEMEGIEINYNDNEFEIPQLLHIPDNRQNTLVVYTPAIPKDSRQLHFFQNNGFNLKKRAVVLGELTSDMRTIAVGGTHGKTTTSSMIAQILKESGHGCNAFLGGIAVNSNSNVLLDPESDWAVVEADEFDRSFLSLSPELAVITSTDADHLDIYGKAADVRASFEAFANKTKPGGVLFARHGLALHTTSGQTLTYGTDSGDIHAVGIQILDGSFHFGVKKNGQRIGEFGLTMPGRHNLENAIAAIAVAHHLGISSDKIAASLASYRGVKRRWEVIFKSHSLVYADDYAHHPTELDAAIATARQFYPGMPIIGFFQPHLFSRTRDFADDFARALSALDVCYLLPIYPARELPIQNITSEWLLDKMPKGKHEMCLPEEVLIKAKAISHGVILTLGAGDIDRQVEPLRKMLIAKGLQT